MRLSPTCSVLLALASTMAFSACTKHSDAADLPDINATVLSCTDGEALTITPGVLLNNMWNRKSAGPGPWRQCLQSRKRDGRTEYGWFWEWPARDGLYAYPEVLVGRSPWQATPSNDARFPRMVSDTPSMWIDYDVDSRTSGKKNLAVEFWLTNAAPAALPDTKAIKTELMIWSEASEGLVSANDKPVAVVDIDGNTWAVHVKRDWGDTSGGSDNTWTLISYHAMAPSSKVRYDARKFFEDAIGRGLIEPQNFIWGVELGNEIVSGAGSTWIKKFQVTIE